MYGFLLFAHLFGLMVWGGAVLAVIVMLLSSDFKLLARRIISIFNRLAHPAAFIVLVSGVFMIIQLDMGLNKPLWLDMMEKGGGTIILLFFLITGIWGSKLKKRLVAAQGQTVALSGYITAMLAFFVLTVSILLVVSMKL